MEAYLQDLTLPPPDLHPEYWGHTHDLYLRALYALVRQEQPRYVVELGTYRGYSTNTIAAALKLNWEDAVEATLVSEIPLPQPRLLTVDLHQDHQYTPPDHLARWVTVLKGNTSDSFLAKRSSPYQAVSGYSSPQWIDILFVDADHSFESTHADFQTWLPYVKPGGLVLFHDIRPLFSWIEGSARHWAVIQERYPGRTSMLPGCEMGVLRLPDCREELHG